MAKLRSLISEPALRAQLGPIEANLRAYNNFSVQIRQAAQAGDTARVISIATVGNIAPSNALPVEFSNLRSALERREAQSAASVRSGASSGTLIVLLVVALALPLLVVLVVTTVRSTMRGVNHVRERVDSLMTRDRDGRTRSSPGSAASPTGRGSRPKTRYATS